MYVRDIHLLLAISIPTFKGTYIYRLWWTNRTSTGLESDMFSNLKDRMLPVIIIVEKLKNNKEKLSFDSHKLVMAKSTFGYQ